MDPWGIPKLMEAVDEATLFDITITSLEPDPTL